MSRNIMIYKEISKLSAQDTLQLVLECETEEEKDFYRNDRGLSSSEKAARNTWKE